MAMSQSRYDANCKDMDAAVAEAEKLANERGVVMVVVQGSSGLKAKADSWHGNFGVIAKADTDIWYAKVKCTCSPRLAVAAQ